MKMTAGIFKGRYFLSGIFTRVHIKIKRFEFFLAEECFKIHNSYIFIKFKTINDKITIN